MSTRISAKIYAEGGGDSQLLDTLFRQGWNAFFKSAGLAGRMPAVVRGKSRESTFKAFRSALRNPRPGELPLLLVDSEGAVSAEHTVWQHLQRRDGWSRPDNVTDDQAFLMVQLMETWFLADRDLLKRYFGGQLRDHHLKAWPDLENVPKHDVLKALDQATAGCDKKYAKGKVSLELLAELNPGKVEASCPHAKALLDRLREI